MRQQQYYVIQQHTRPEGVHWDLMLQSGDVLWTWRLCAGPGQIQNASIRAEKIADHPLRFLTYEGPVQNNTGSVKIADCGEYQATNERPGRIGFDACGKILNGHFTLEQSEGTHWVLRKIV